MTINMNVFTDLNFSNYFRDFMMNMNKDQQYDYLY